MQVVLRKINIKNKSKKEKQMDYFEEAGGKLKKTGIASICIALAIITMKNEASICHKS